MTSPQYSYKVRIFLMVVCPHLVGSTVLLDPPRLVPLLRLPIVKSSAKKYGRKFQQEISRKGTCEVCDLAYG